MLKLNKDHKKDIKTLADALRRLHRRDVGYKTLGGELGGLIQALTQAEYQAAFCSRWPDGQAPIPDVLGVGNEVGQPRIDAPTTTQLAPPPG